jgi:tRNA modification GTPase
VLDGKIDRDGGLRAGRIEKDRFAVSAKTGAGLDGLLDALSGWIDSRVGGETEALITRSRHRRELERAVAALGQAAALDYVRDSDLVAEELRVAAAAVGRVSGRVDVEDVLDAIFRQFCIGK